jgi:hypothetical protein
LIGNINPGYCHGRNLSLQVQNASCCCLLMFVAKVVVVATVDVLALLLLVLRLDKDDNGACCLDDNDDDKLHLVVLEFEENKLRQEDCTNRSLATSTTCMRQSSRKANTHIYLVLSLYCCCFRLNRVRRHGIIILSCYTSPSPPFVLLCAGCCCCCCCC